MSSYFTRSALEYWFGPQPRNIAGRANGRDITWDEVMDQRRKDQARRLDMIRNSNHIETRAIRISVSHFGSWFMGGYHCYIDRYGDEPHWVKHHDSPGAFILREAFPLSDKWGEWKEAFAHRYAVNLFNNEPRGVIYCMATYHGGHLRQIHKDTIRWPATKPTQLTLSV